MRSGPVGVGIIGAGVISKTYVDNLVSFPDTQVLAIGDLYPELAQQRAADYGLPVGGDVDVVLGHPDVEIVVNLTIPAAHAAVAHQAIAAGRHVWNEKPLALDRDSARGLLTAAAAAGVRVGCAPDTFLGAGLQAARAAVERGEIGDPLTALVLLQTPGPESWHPNPAFLFAPGAGPLFDMGPYYLTALVQQFGPVASVAALGSTSRAVRVIGSGPRAGTEFAVGIPTHVGALLAFESGQSAQCIFSFDSAVPRTLLEINGTLGTMVVPDPNMFGGEVAIRRPGVEEQLRTVVSASALSTRGTGVLEMARAIRADRPHRASGALAYHVLDTLLAISEAVESGGWVLVDSTAGVVPLLPAEWDPHLRTL